MSIIRYSLKLKGGAMQGIDMKNIEISDFQKFLREVNAAIWTEKGKIMYYEEKLTGLKELPINEENKKLISKYIDKIEEAKSKLAELKIKLENEQGEYDNRIMKYQFETVPDGYKRIETAIYGKKDALGNFMEGSPLSSLIFAVPIDSVGEIEAVYDEHNEIVVKIKNFEIGTDIYKWLTLENCWNKLAITTSKNMVLHI